MLVGDQLLDSVGTAMQSSGRTAARTPSASTGPGSRDGDESRPRDQRGAGLPGSRRSLIRLTRTNSARPRAELPGTTKLTRRRAYSGLESSQCAYGIWAEREVV